MTAQACLAGLLCATRIQTPPTAFSFSLPFSFEAVLILLFKRGSRSGSRAGMGHEPKGRERGKKKKRFLPLPAMPYPKNRLRADEQVGVFVRPPFEGEIFCRSRREVPACADVKRFQLAPAASFSALPSSGTWNSRSVPSLVTSAESWDLIWPRRISSARGSSRYFSTARRIGRAP